MTDQNEEWGPWIEHDGSGCPCPGKWTQVVWECSEVEPLPGSIASERGRSWDARYAHTHEQIIRYRIRKPRALSQLQKMIQSLPERIDA